MWKKVPSYEFLEVTRDGRVRTAEETRTHFTRWGQPCEFLWKARELKPSLHSNGYYRFQILRNGVRSPVYLHRMIALAFVDGYQDGLQVNHKNGIKTDNRPDNLEWVSRETNVRVAWQTGLTGGRYFRFKGKKSSART